MRQLNPSFISTRQILPVVEHTVVTYKLWYQYKDHIPKKSRHDLGNKIDSLFVEILELLFVASYQKQGEKSLTVETAIKKIDLLKFFLRVAWEVQALDDKKYIALSKLTLELGRMVGGWKKALSTKTPM